MIEHVDYELGHYRRSAGVRVPVSIRTTRVFGYDHEAGRRLQVHHHGSIDEPGDLEAYQRTVRGASA